MSSCCPPTPSHRSIRSDSLGSVPITSAKVHLHLHVASLADAVTFYRAFFGEAPVKEHPGYAKFLPSWAPVNLALSEHLVAGSGPISHVGIQLPDAPAVQQQLIRVQAAGLQVRVEMGVDCCHSNQDKFWVRDPAGVEWEVYVLNHDLASSPAPASGTTPQVVPACCAPGQCG